MSTLRTAADVEAAHPQWFGRRMRKLMQSLQCAYYSHWTDRVDREGVMDLITEALRIVMVKEPAMAAHMMPMESDVEAAKLVELPLPLAELERVMLLVRMYCFRFNKSLSMHEYLFVMWYDLVPFS
jgi:hypothetical protein